MNPDPSRHLVADGVEDVARKVFEHPRRRLGNPFAARGADGVLRFEVEIVREAHPDGAKPDSGPRFDRAPLGFVRERLPIAPLRLEMDGPVTSLRVLDHDAVPGVRT